MSKKYILFGKNKNNPALIRAMEQITYNLTSDLGGPALESVFNKYTGAGLTEAEREGNAFSAEQAQINRDFQSEEAALQRDWSAAEAERARDWNEEMYYKYNSLQGKINQANEAGVNPMLAVTGNAVSPMTASSSAPSGASASGSSASASSSGFVDLIGSLMGIVKLKSEIDLNESQANKNNADAEVSLAKVASEISVNESISSLNMQKVIESATSVEKIKSDIGLNEKQAEVFAAQISKLNAEADRLSKITDLEVREKQAKVIVDEWNEKNKETFKAIEIGSEGLRILTDLGLGILSSKTGIKIAEIRNSK